MNVVPTPGEEAIRGTNPLKYALAVGYPSTGHCPPESAARVWHAASPAGLGSTRTQKHMLATHFGRGTGLIVAALAMIAALVVEKQVYISASSTSCKCFMRVVILRHKFLLWAV
jgi:hypothetical protein